MEWKLDNPKNQWAKVVKILLLEYDNGVSMAKVLTKYYREFYKFSTRLCDIERNEKDFMVSKETKTYRDADGKTSHYTQYNPINTKKYLKELYIRLNKDGLVGYHKNGGR